MTNFIFQLFDHGSDVIEATEELDRLGVHARDISIISGAPETRLESEALFAPHKGIDGNRAAEFVRTAPHDAGQSARDTLIARLVDAGASVANARVYAASIQRGRTLLAVRAAKLPARDIAATLNHYRSVPITASADEYSNTGWSSVPTERD